MTSLSTYVSAGWDFTNVWSIADTLDYPRLLWQIPAADFQYPYGVGFEDYTVFAASWLTENPAINLAGPDIIDYEDLHTFAANWLSAR